MKKLIFFIALIILIPVLVFGQENANFQQNFFLTKVQLDSGNAVSVKFMFPRNPASPTAIGTVTASRFSIVAENGQFWNPGFYRLWTRGDTTAAGNEINATDSLKITAYELNFDGTRGDQTSTVVVDQLDWTADTWHGPFVLTVFGPAFGIELLVQKFCASDADTSEQVIQLIY